MVRSEKKRFVSFDGRIAADCECYRPERYAELEVDLGNHRRITRGSGYSYAAASFGKNVAVQDMRRFCRIIRFDPENLTLEAEAGVTVGDLLRFTVPRRLWLPTIPGYPGITLGGCLAANVHGKNPSVHGLFSRYVMEFTLFHPLYGRKRISRETNPLVFDLTAGGFGLTGIIETVTLQLMRFEGQAFHVNRFPVYSPEQALDELLQLTGRSEYAYSFHDATPSSRYGRGYVLSAKITDVEGPDSSETSMKRRLLTARTRGFLPASVWGGWRSNLIHSIFWSLTSSRKVSHVVPWFTAEFPFASSPSYFIFYGAPGFREYQLIIPHEAAWDFFAEVQRLLRKQQPDVVMCSLKLFRGSRRFLHFSGDGVCFTLDAAAGLRADAFFDRMDDLCIAFGGLPNVIKDSRLPKHIVSSTYPEYELFRSELGSYDKARFYTSELAQRLDL